MDLTLLREKQVQNEFKNRARPWIIETDHVLNTCAVYPAPNEDQAIRQLSYKVKDVFKSYTLTLPFNPNIATKKKTFLCFVCKDVVLVPKYFNSGLVDVQEGAYHHVAATERALHVVCVDRNGKMHHATTDEGTVIVVGSKFKHYYYVASHQLFMQIRVFDSLRRDLYERQSVRLLDEEI